MAPSSPFASKRVFITGANGFIGSQLAGRLAREGAVVHGLVSPESRGEKLEPLAGSVTIEKADIRHAGALKSVVGRVKPHIVYHLASYGNHSLHYRGAAEEALLRMAEVNMMGTANLLAACHDLDVECLVNTGSAFAEYGPASTPMHEKQRLDPSTYYGASKAGATLLANAFAKHRQRKVITLRPLYVYGPGESPQRFVPTVISKCLNGERLSLTSLNEKKNFVFIEDVLEAYVLAYRTHYDEAPIVNIGSAEESTLGDVIGLVEEHFGKRIEYVEGAYRELQWPSECWRADISLARELLGWRPTTDLKAGIRNTADWMVNSSESRLR